MLVFWTVVVITAVESVLASFSVSRMLFTVSQILWGSQLGILPYWL
jgi:hypothetical protein